jgi:hypothetical protein
MCNVIFRWMALCVVVAVVTGAFIPEETELTKDKIRAGSGGEIFR